MKITLASTGLTGLRVVNYKQPTYQAIKDMSDVEDLDFVLKTEFVQKLLKEDVSKLTTWDRDYLYTIALSSMSANKLSYNIKCTSCKRVYKHDLPLSELDVYDLPQGTKPVIKKEYNGNVWGFKVPLVSDELSALDICYNLTGEYKESVYDNIFASNLIQGSWKPDYSSIDGFKESLLKLPVSVFMGAHAFQSISFHGVDLTSSAVCSHCGNKHTHKFQALGSHCKLSTETLMQLYSNMSDLISYTDFLNMTASEYTALVKAENAKFIE